MWDLQVFGFGTWQEDLPVRDIYQPSCHVFAATAHESLSFE